MQAYAHPKSNAEISGLLLGSGATLRQEDVYDSSDGQWRTCPCPGMKLEANAGAVWIRPNADLSRDGQGLLMHLVTQDFYLTLTTHWKVIPSAGWKNDGRMDWKVLHPECVEELQELGFVEPTLDDPKIFQVTDAGQAYCQTLRQ